MSSQRMIVIGGVSVGLWWLFFTCKGREVLNRALRALKRPELKPCCAGCSDHIEPGAVSSDGSPLPSPSPASPQAYGATFVPEPSGVSSVLPSLGLPGLSPVPEGSYAPVLPSYAPPPLRTAVAESYDKPASSLACVEPACRPYAAPVDVKDPRTKWAPEPVPYVDPNLKPPVPYVKPDALAGTVGPLAAVRTVLRDAFPSFLKPAPDAPAQAYTAESLYDAATGVRR